MTPFRMIQELEELIHLPSTEPPSTHLRQDSPDVVV
jgi:hypothetical protein